MSETKMMMRFFTIADFSEEEIWLREEHKAGWKLAKMTPPCFYKFEKCEPEDVIYRLDFKNNAENEDYFQMMSLLVIFLCCIVPNILRVVAGEGGLVFTCFWAIMLIIYIYLLVHCGYKLWKMKKELAGLM